MLVTFWLAVLKSKSKIQFASYSAASRLTVTLKQAETNSGPYGSDELRSVRVAQKSADYVSTVNHVISICKDAQEGFLGAAKAVDDPILKSTFDEYSNQRRQFALELETVVSRAGAEPSHPSGLAGKVHSGWMALKGALTGHSAHQILEETERGEDLSIKQYREALDNDLPDEIRSVLDKQFRQVQDAHARIRSLRDSTSK